MDLRDETLAPMIRNQVSVRGNQCRQTEGVDGAERVGLVLNIACPMSLRGNDFHIAVLLSRDLLHLVSRIAPKSHSVCPADAQYAPRLAPIAVGTVRRVWLTTGGQLFVAYDVRCPG